MSPTTFISYAQQDGSVDVRPHARAFADRLVGDGVDAMVDLYLTVPPSSWRHWMHGQITSSEFVVVLCTASYKEKAEGPQSGGVGWESMIITGDIYDDLQAAGTKFLPVTLDGDRSNVPYYLRGTTAFDLSDPESYLALLRVLFKVPAISRPPLGQAPPEIARALGGSLGSAGTSPFAAVAMGSRWPTHRELIVIDSGGGAHHTWSEDVSTSFGAWRALAPFPDDRPRAAASSSFTYATTDMVPLDVFVLASSGAVWATGVPAADGRWAAWRRVALTRNANALASSALWPGHAEVFVLGDGHLQHMWRQGVGVEWSDLHDMEVPPGVRWVEVGAASCASAKVEGSQVLVLVGDRGEVAYRLYSVEETSWLDWTKVGAGASGLTAIHVVTDGSLLLLVGRDGDDVVLSGWDLSSGEAVGRRALTLDPGDWIPLVSAGVRTQGMEIFCLEAERSTHLTFDSLEGQVVGMRLVFGA